MRTACTDDMKLMSCMTLLVEVFMMVSLRGVSAGCSPGNSIDAQLSGY